MNKDSLFSLSVLGYLSQAESDTKFFLRIAGVEIDFVKNSKGEVVKFISDEEKDYELKKIK